MEVYEQYLGKFQEGMQEGSRKVSGVFQIGIQEGYKKVPGRYQGRL